MAMPGKFLGFALAYKSAGAWCRELLHTITHHLGSGSGSQLGKFLQRIVGIGALAGLDFDAHEKDSFSPSVPRLDQCFQLSASTSFPVPVSIPIENTTITKAQKGGFFWPPHSMQISGTE